jgi:2-haloacid dehalogenase
MVTPHTPHETADADTTIDTVVYDFGNVLIRWDPYGAFDPGRRAEVDSWMAELDFPAFNHLQDAGRTWAQARAELAETRPDLVPLVDEYFGNFTGTLLGPVPGSERLVRELKSLGLRLYGLTNWSSDLFHHAEPVAPAIGLMDGVVVSGLVGAAKPDPRIFERLMTDFDVDPECAVFVDDSAANVAAARELGFRTVHFTDTPTLRAALRTLGIPVSGAPDQPSPRHTT